MKKESFTNSQKYSGVAEQMLKLFSDCPETAKILFDIIYGDEGIRLSSIDQTAQ